MLSKLTHSKQKGVTLIEVMLVLAIVSIILVTATRYYRTTVTTQRANETLAFMTNMVGGMEVWRGARFNYANITLRGLRDGGYLPIEINDQFQIPWLNNATLTLDTVSRGGMAADHAIVRIVGMPREVCESLGDRLPFRSADSTGAGEHTGSFFGICENPNEGTYKLIARAQGDGAICEGIECGANR